MFIAVISAMDSSMVLFAADKEAAERVRASPIPAEEMAKLFNLLLSRRHGTDRLRGDEAFLPRSAVSF